MEGVSLRAKIVFCYKIHLNRQMTLGWEHFLHCDVNWKNKTQIIICLVTRRQINIWLLLF